MATAKRSPRRRQGRPPEPAWKRQWPILAVLAVIAAVVAVFIYLAGHQAPPKATPTTTGSVITQVTSPNAAVASQVGAGGLQNPLKVASGAAPLTGSDGKPEVLYIGAEYCPYCAAERWSMVYALSRFGTFGGLDLTTSSSTDVYPNTPTLTFRHSTFQSSVISFSGVEIADRTGGQLEVLTPAQQAVIEKLDPAGSIPFISIGNRYTEVGSGYRPDPLQGLSWDQIAAQLSDPKSAVTQAVVGNANYLTAAICRISGEQPSSVCSDPAIQALEAKLG